MFQEYFSGKAVLVTGVGRGIGRELAKRLHSYGAKVTGVGKTESYLSTLRSECPGLVTLCVDLGDWDATRVALKGHGPFHYLVNNAAILISGGFMDIKQKDFNNLFSVNVLGCINVAQIVADGMISACIKGSILNVSSVAGIHASPDIAIYSLSKAAVDMMTKIMAVELGPKGIRVNAVNPGGVPTDMLNIAMSEYSQKKGMGSMADLEKAMASRFPLGKLVMEMDDVINPILFMLSPSSGMIHGEGLVIDGGFTHT